MVRSVARSMMSTPSALGKRLVIGAWLGLVALIAVRVWIHTADLQPLISITLADVLTYELPMLLTIITGAILALRIRSGVEHRFWGLLVAATSLVLPAELHWTWYAATVDPRGPEVGFTQLLQLAAALLFFGVIVTMTTLAEQPITTQLRFYLDLLSAGALVYPAVYLGWTLPAFAEVTDPARNLAAGGALYPIMGVALVVSALAVAFGWRAHRWRVWERLICVSLIICGVGLAAFPLWYPQMVMSDVTVVSWFTLPIGIAYYLLFIAGVYRLTSGDQPRVEPWPVPRIGPRRIWRLYPVVLASAVLIAGWLSATAEDRTVARTLLDAAVVTAVIVGLRSWLSALERVRHERSALTEPTTGALTSEALAPCIKRKVAIAAHYGREVSIVVMGLCGTGQSSRDAALTLLHGTMQRLAPAETPIFRRQPTSFVAVLDGCSSDEALLYGASVWQELGEKLGDGGVVFDVSGGVATFPIHSMDSADLLARAETAQLQARSLPRAPILVWNEGLDEAVAQDTVNAVRMRTLRATVRSLARAVDARDISTQDHSTNVSELVMALGQLLELPLERVEMLGLAALVHDVGKVALGDDVLTNPGPLTAEQRCIVAAHPLMSERIVAAARLNDLLPIVRHHHEWWDGSGYPDGLAGEAIPLESRVLAVCDAFEVMTSGRAWAVARPVASALGELETLAGTQFDPHVVDRFARLLAGMGALSHENSVVMPVIGERKSAS